MVRQVVHRAVLYQLLRSPAGPVARDMLRRGYNVQARARRNLNESPRRIDTGLLRGSITVRLVTISRTLAVRVGTRVVYARYVHDGTGIYGPRHRLIRPRRAKALRFRPKGQSRYVFARSVKGMRPNPFLRDALPAARD